MTEPTLSIEHELLRDGLLFDDIEVVEQKINPTVGDDDLHVVMTLQADQELLGSTVFGLAYVLAVLSFADARPRGTSGKWFEDDDQFSSADLLRRVGYRLVWHAR